MITRIQPNFCATIKQRKKEKSQPVEIISNQNKFAKIPTVSYHAVSNISFTAKAKRVPDIVLADYLELPEEEKARLRRKCAKFDKIVNPDDLFVIDKRYLPLSAKGEMKQYVEFSKQYNKLKGSPIICLGRSPKWPLSTSSWMKDGIDGYTYAAFSKSWYDKKTDWRTGERYLQKNEAAAPSEAQESAYRLYLKLINADPKSIIESAQKAGTEVVITDYVETSKGLTSFLDLTSRFAEKQEVLDEFSKSIKFFLIGSKQYSESFYNDDESISNVRAVFPDTLEKVLPRTLYGHPYPKQEYHDMPLEIFKQMLVNENTNECRSTFYPKENWTLMKPCHSKPQFSTGMRDFRNLLNFRILDYLNAKDLLKLV